MPSLSLELSSGQEANATRNAILTPLALLSMLNHYSRCEQDEYSIGVLLGTRSGDKVTATQSIPLKVSEHNNINLELLEQMYSSVKELNPQESLIGWYQFGQLSQFSTEINNQLMDEISPKQPLIVLVEHEKFGLEYPITCYVPKPCKTPQSTSKGAMFLEIPFESGPLTNHFQQLSYGPNQPTGDFETLKATLLKLKELIKVIAEYVHNVQVKKIKQDPKIGKYLEDTLAQIPKLDPKVFKHVIQSHSDDLEMVKKLVSLTRKQLQLAAQLHEIAKGSA